MGGGTRATGLNGGPWAVLRWTPGMPEGTGSVKVKRTRRQAEAAARGMLRQNPEWTVEVAPVEPEDPGEETPAAAGPPPDYGALREFEEIRNAWLTEQPPGAVVTPYDTPRALWEHPAHPEFVNQVARRLRAERAKEQALLAQYRAGLLPWPDPPHWAAPFKPPDYEGELAQLKRQVEAVIDGLAAGAAGARRAARRASTGSRPP